MKIGELFVALGFKIDGADDMKSVEKSLKESTIAAGKLAAGVDIVVGALSAMIHTAVDAAVGFQKFNLTTGLSSSELQQWLYTASLANVSASELTESVKALQMAGVKVSATGEGFGAWALLGIDPRQNPFTILRQLQNELQSIDQRRVAAARYIVTQAGISDDVFQMLRRPPVTSLPARFVVNPQDQKALEDLNREWQQTIFLATQVKNKFSADLAPAVGFFLNLIEHAVDWLSRFTDWLGRGSAGAQVVKVVLIGLGVALGTLATLLTVTTAALGAMAFAAAALDVSLAPILLTIAAIAAAAGIAAAGIYGLAKARHALDDADAGKPSKISPAARAHARYGIGAFETAAALTLPSPASLLLGHGLSDMWKGARDFVTHPSGGPTVKSVSVQQNVQMKIDGAQSPERTGAAVKDALANQLLQAALSAQAPTQ